MTYSFSDPADVERLGHELELNEARVELLNPMSGEQSVLRRSVLPGLLRSVSYNQHRGVSDVHLYEIGSTFRTTEGSKQPTESSTVAGVLAGAWHRPEWNDPAPALDFFDGKGVLEQVASELGLKHLRLRVADLPHLQPGRSAEVLLRDEVIGWLGEVHPLVLDAFEAEATVTAFEILFAPLVRDALDAKPFSDVPRFPSVELDVALVVPEAVTAESVEQAVLAAKAKLLESVRLFDVYRGTGVPAGSKSMAFSLVYRAPDRTLSAEEIEKVHTRLVRKVCDAVGGEIRG